MAKPKNSAAADALVPFLQQAADALGIRLTVTEAAFEQALLHYYRQEDRTYNLFFLGTDFSVIFDPYYDFHTDDLYQGVQNTTGIADEALMEEAGKMRATPPGNRDEYLEHWLSFQKRFAELMPMVPLYSALYIDVHSNQLQGYDVRLYGNWPAALLYAYPAS